jgi:hypothetical protein
VRNRISQGRAGARRVKRTSEAATRLAAVAFVVLAAAGACGNPAGSKVASGDIADRLPRATTTEYTPESTYTVPTTETTVYVPPTTEPPTTEAPRPTPTRTPTTRRAYSPPPTAAPSSGGAPCHPSYSPCIADEGTDVDCAGGSGNGPRYVHGPVQVHGPDEYDLDRDGNGVGCES